MFVTNDFLRLRVQVKIPPQYSPEVGFFDSQFIREYLGEFSDAEPPATESRSEYDVSLLWGKVDILVVFLLEIVSCLVVHKCVCLLRNGILLTCDPPLAFFTPSEIVLHTLASKEAAHDCICLLDELREMVIRLHGRLPEFRYETV